MSNYEYEAKGKAVAGCGCLVLLVILALAFIPFYRMSAQSFNAMVVKTVVDDGDTFFVVTTDGGVTTQILENEDSFSFFKFDSNDLLMEIEVGQTYTFKVAGWRVPFFSWFRNVIDATPAPAE
jgi:hypothetical protein